MDPPISNHKEDINLSYLEHCIQEEQTKFQEDKLKFKKNIETIKKQQSDGNHHQLSPNYALPKEKYENLPNKVSVNDQVKEKYFTKDKSTIFMIKNSREEEITRLIDKISKPKENQSFASNSKQRKTFTQTRSEINQLPSPVNIREKEKDKLSEKFASSDSPLTPPTSRQVAKNLCSSISFTDCKQSNLEEANIKRRSIRNSKQQYCFGTDKNEDLEKEEEYLRAKYNHPRIVISHFKEKNKDNDIDDTKGNKMVRFGEFSPLNPNLPGGPTVLGLGDWDEKRQQLLLKYRQESRSPSPSHSEDDHSHTQRTIATQTDMVGDDWSSSLPMEKGPQNPCPTMGKSLQNFHVQRHDGENKRCTSPQSRLSPIPKCFENMTEKEFKEFIYRQELAKQIEEKNRLKEEIRKKEAEEEAKIEAKIQRDLVKMRQQYEEERLQRLELAIRRQEQEDILREKLAVEQQKTMQESKVVKKRLVKDSALLNHTHNEKSTQSDFKRPAKVNIERASLSQSSPERSVASALSSVHEELRQPLLQPSRSSPFLEGRESFQPGTKPPNPPLNKAKKSTVHTSTSPPIPKYRSKEVDILAQKAVFDMNLRTSPNVNNAASFYPDSARERLKEVDNILKQPLLPENHLILPPVSQPLLHATIPPLSASMQAPRGAALPTSNRTNTEILEDRWKVPFVVQDTELASNTKQNPRILTQLGTFRRQLQEESLRMRQRVREDSP